MVRRIDSCIGDLTQLLDDMGIEEDTLVVFTNDNGPLAVGFIEGEPFTPIHFQSYGPFDGENGISGKAEYACLLGKVAGNDTRRNYRPFALAISRLDGDSRMLLEYLSQRFRMAFLYFLADGKR